MSALKEAFDAVQASEAQKTQTAQAVLGSMRRRPSRWRRPLVTAALCLLLVLGVGGYHLYTTPTTVLSIDVNPSLEMDINRFDRVVSVSGYNADGVALAERLDVRGARYDEAVDALMADRTVSDCMARGEDLSIAVVQSETSDQAQCDAVLDYVSSCTMEANNAHCYMLESDTAQMDDAHDAGLSCGKYHLYEALRRAGVAITEDEVRTKSVRELEALLAENNAEARSSSRFTHHAEEHHSMMHE